MRIKMERQKVRNQSGLNDQSINPQFNSRLQTRKGIIFQSQFKSLQNYVSILHHIFGRDVRAKEILKSLTNKEKRNQNQLQIQVTDISDCEENNAIDSNMIKSTLSEIHQSPQRSLPNNQRYELHRPKWKQSILRRKNNGSQGEILKGNPKNNHSRLMNRFNTTDEAFEVPPRQSEKLAKEEFIPVGKMQHEPTQHNFPYKRDAKSQLGTKPKAKLLKSNRRQVVLRQVKKPQRAVNSNQILNLTCFPRKNSMDMSDSITIRKSIVSTPHRYKSRLSTPCPWDYTTHR